MTNLILPRRGFLKGLVALIAAPAVVRAESLMPIVPWRPEFWFVHGGGMNVLSCRADDLIGFDLASVGIMSPGRDGGWVRWWSYSAHPLGSLRRNKVRLRYDWQRQMRDREAARIAAGLHHWDVKTSS
jgi:hypothetical protein